MAHDSSFVLVTILFPKGKYSIDDNDA